MDFMLNLILTFTDKATGGLQSAVGVLGTINGQVNKNISTLQKVGNVFGSLTKMGMGMTAAITAPISAFMTKIISYGVQRASFIEDSKLAFTSLMGDAKTASDELNRLLDFAKTTPFTYEGIANSAQNMISAGLDNLTVLESKADGTFGGILQALGDLAGASGKGAAGFEGMANVVSQIAIEGKASTMRLQQFARAGIDASKLVADAFGKTQAEATAMLKSMSSDEFVKTIVDIVEAEDSAYKGMMSQIKLTWTGAKDTFVSSLKTAGLELMGAFQDEEGTTRYQFLENMTEGLNDLSASIKAISPVLMPVMDFINASMNKGAKMVRNFAESLTELNAETNERELTNKGKAISKLISALTLAGPALIVFGKFGQTATVILGTLTKAMGTTAGSVASGFTKLIPLMGLAYLAWRTDFLGIRSLLEDLANNTKSAWDYATDAVSQSAGYMKLQLKLLDKDTFFGKLTEDFMKLIVLVRSVSDLWSDGEMDADLYYKAVDLGVAETAGQIYDLKVRVEEFMKGFAQGWEETGNKFKTFIEGLADAVKGTPIEGVLKGITDAISSITKADVKQWGEWGKSLGEVMPKVIVAATGFTALTKGLKLFSKIKPKGKGGLLGGLLGGDKENPVEKMTKGGDKLRTFATDLLIVAGAMWLIGDAAAKVGNSNEGLAALTLMLIGIGALAGVFSKLGSSLDEALPGMLAFGGALVMIGVGMQLMTGAALQLASGGNEAVIALAALAGVVVVFAVAMGVLSSVGLVGAAVMLAFGAAVMMIGAGVMLASAGISMLAEQLPTISEYGTSAAVGIAELDLALAGFAVSVALAGAASLIAAAGFAALYLPLRGVAKHGKTLSDSFVLIYKAIKYSTTWIKSFKSSLESLTDTSKTVKSAANELDTTLNDLSSTGSEVSTSLQNSFSQMESSVIASMNTAVAAVVSGIARMKAATNFSWKLPHLQVPHITVTGAFNLEPPTAPKFNVNWYAKGGVIEQPTIIGAGEQGKEAVVPLERNTEWITAVAREFMKYIPVNSDTNTTEEGVKSPIDVEPVNTSVPEGGTSPAPIVNVPASGGNTTKTDSRSFDNSVTFNAGAIVIQSNGTSEADAKRFAQQIMRYIARQQQIQKQTNYGIDYRAGV